MFPLPDAHQWTKEQDATLINDWGNHTITLGAIARKFDLSEQAIWRRARYLGLPNPRQNKWPLEKVERLKKLWDLGWSSTLIGRDLGISRNAVIGKKNRLKLSGRRSTNEAERQRRVERVAAKKIAKAAGKVFREKPQHFPEFTPLNPNNPGITIDDLRWDKGKPANCRAIIKHNLYCGEPNYPGESYCPGHCAINYNNWKPIQMAAE